MCVCVLGGGSGGLGLQQQPDDEVNKLGAELLILKRKKLLQKPETYTETGTLNRLNWC